MSLLIAQYTISRPERVPKKWNIVHNLGVVWGRNDTLWTTMGSFMLSKILSIIIIHLRKVRKHSSSNVCLALKFCIPFPMLKGCLKLLILCAIWESTWMRMTRYGPQWAHICYQEFVQSSPYTWGRLWNTQAVMDVSPYSTIYHFPSWEGTPKMKYCTQFGSCLGQKWHPHVDHNGLICAVKNTFNHHYTC